MDNNLFNEKQIEYMYSNPSFFRFVNEFFSTYSLTSQNMDMKIDAGSLTDSDLNIYIRIILSNLSEFRKMLSSIEKSLSYMYKDKIQTFDGEIHGHLRVQKYLQTKTQVRYPKEYPCLIKERTSATPENIFLIFIVDYLIHLLDRFDKRLRQYGGNLYLSEKNLIDEYKRILTSFERKTYFKDCLIEVRRILKEYGNEFSETLVNEIKIRSLKGKIRNYQAYEQIFNWYWRYRQGSIVLDSNKTMQMIRYSDDFSNRLFELWCLFSIKETFVNEFGMNIISERNIMDVGSKSVFTLQTNTGGIVDIFYQRGASLYWSDQIEPRWKYIGNDSKQKRLVGIPDISIKYQAETNTLVMIDLKNRIRSSGNNSEEIYKMIGYFDNFRNMFQEKYSSDIKKQAILIFRNDISPFSERLMSEHDLLLNTYSVSPSQKDILNVEQFKEICQCILDSQGIDGKTSSVYGNYQKEKEKLSEAFDESNEDERFYTLSDRNHAIICNMFSFGELQEELPKQMELLRQNYFPHIWDEMALKTKEILAMADCLFSGMKECEGADYAPICLEYCRGMEVQLNQLIFQPFRSSHDVSLLARRNRFYEKMQENREMTLGECVFFLDKCTHRAHPMTELKTFIDGFVKNPNIFYSEVVSMMRDINTNIRRLSAHTTIMTYDELVNTRQQILGIGYMNIFYQMLDKR